MKAELKHYLLVVWNDVDPEILGPFDSQAARDNKAREIVLNDVERDHGVYPLDSVDGKPGIGKFAKFVLAN